MERKRNGTAKAPAALPYAPFDRFAATLRELASKPLHSSPVRVDRGDVARALQRLGFLDRDSRTTPLLHSAAATSVDQVLRSDEFREHLKAVYGPVLIDSSHDFERHDLDEAFASTAETYRHKVVRFYAKLSQACGLRVKRALVRSFYKNQPPKESPAAKKPAKTELRVPAPAEREWVYRTYQLLGGRVLQVKVVGAGELTNREMKFLSDLPEAEDAPGVGKRRTMS